jgi:ferredoxin
VSGNVQYNEEPLAFVRDGEILLCCSKPNGDIRINLK